MEGVHLTQCPQLPVSNPHDNLAYRLAREHVLNRVRHAFQAVERALAVDERDQLAARVQIEHALLAASDGAKVLGPGVAVDGLLAARDRLRLPEERARLELVARGLGLTLGVVRVLGDVANLGKGWGWGWG